MVIIAAPLADRESWRCRVVPILQFFFIPRVGYPFFFRQSVNVLFYVCSHRGDIRRNKLLSLSLCLSLCLSLSLSLSLLYRAHSASHILSFSHISCADKENKQRNRECDRGEIGHDHVTMRSQIIAVTMSQHKDTVTSR